MIPYTIHPRPYTITYEIFYFLVPHTIPKDCLNFSNNLAKNFREIVCCKPCLTNCPLQGDLLVDADIDGQVASLVVVVDHKGP